MRSRSRTLAPVTVLFTLLALLLPTGAVATAAATAPGPLPVVTPRPQEMSRIAADIHVPARVRLVISDGVDRPTRDLVTSVLRRAGASRIQDGPGPTLTVTVGRIADPRVARALRAAGGEVPARLPAEGYALAA